MLQRVLCCARRQRTAQSTCLLVASHMRSHTLARAATARPACISIVIRLLACHICRQSKLERQQVEKDAKELQVGAPL